MSLEMHCHSLFSVDGRGTPEDLVDVAANRGITTLALTDHNCIGGLPRAQAQAARRGIRFLAGVEFDATWKDRGYHFVALGFNPEDRDLSSLVDRNFSVYEHSFRLHLKYLQASGFQDIEQTLVQELADRYPSHPNPVLNQWFARDVLLKQGAVSDREAFGRLMADARKQVVIDMGSDVFRRFVDLEEVLPAVHNAGGILVLAHVAHYFPGDAEAQLALIRELAHHGLDGFELHHPLNLSEPHFGRLISEAANTGCVTTGGSDCHDSSQNDHNPIGCCNVPVDLLDRINEAISVRRTGSTP